MASPRLKSVEQLGFDEQVIEDASIEAALEEREKRKASLGAVRKVFDAAHEVAKAKITELELPEGGAARIGRFRITRQAVAARSVTFDTKASSRVRISVVDEDAAPAAPRASSNGHGATDDEDLRPRGVVNADLLRGEADRS